MENKDRPASPVPNLTANEAYRGLTKLEEFTKAAMQGLCADPDKLYLETIGKEAVVVARATLEELEK